MDQIASAFDQDDAVVLEIDESEVKPRWGVQTDRHPPHIALRRVVADGGRQRRKVIFNLKDKVYKPFHSFEHQIK